MSALWAIHIPGPDEYHAAPSEAAARHMADKHNAAMTEYVAEKKPDWGINYITASAVPWPSDAESHAEEMRDFDYAGWGLKDGAQP